MLYILIQRAALSVWGSYYTLIKLLSQLHLAIEDKSAAGGKHAKSIGFLKRILLYYCVTTSC